MSQPFDDEDSVTFAPVDDGQNIASDPFDRASGGASFMSNTSFDSKGSSGGISLLERIQQQKMQSKGNTSTASSIANEPESSMSLTESASRNDAQVYEEETYNFGIGGSEAENSNPLMNIPDYAASINRGHTHQVYTNADVKDQFFSVMSTVGNGMTTAGKGIYRGSKYLYNNIMNKRQSNSYNGDRMAEMDYQRQSLLLDPHEVEDGAFAPPTTTGLGGGSDGLSSHSSNGHPILAYMKQFCIDMKDIFMGLSPNMKLFVIAFVAFLIWLFISEEWHHEH